MSKTLVYDLGGTKCDVAVFDSNSNILQKKRVFTKSTKSQEAVIRQLTDLADEFTNQFKITKCVIGVPGIVAHDRSTIINIPNIIGFQNLDLGKIFQQKFPQMQTYLENDANLFTLGALQKIDSQVEIFVGITLGTGIGGGIVINNKLLRGADSLVGEFGHTVIDFNGELCHCGQHGCWERYASASALIRRIQTYLQKNPQTTTILPQTQLNMNQVSKALFVKDKFCFKMLQESIPFLAIGLSNLINTIDPNIIFFGGSLGNLLQYYKEDLEKEIRWRLVGKKMKCKFLNSNQKDLNLIGGFFYSKQ